MDFETLHIFNTLADLGSYTETSKELFISKSTITNRMAFLEKEIGFNPFDKKRKGIILNAKGKELLRLSKEIELLVEKIQRIQEDSSKEFECLRIGCGEFFAISYLLPILNKLKVRYPELKFKLDIGDASSLIEKMLRGTLDIIITFENSKLESMDQYFLSDIRIGAMMHYEHPLAEKENIQISDILMYPLIVRKKGTLSRSILEKYLGSSVRQGKIFLEVTNNDMIVTALKTGYGDNRVIGVITTLFDQYDREALLCRTIHNLQPKKLLVYTKPAVSNCPYVNPLISSIQYTVRMRTTFMERK